MILVTNDDGIMAPGIRALIEVAKNFGEVLVVAPDSPQSGQGHAITITKPLKLHRVDLMENVVAYECSGTPVDCVKLAKNVLLKNEKIDLCLSGINHGSNASINIIYSGTMSAAMEASLEGVDSIGFSLLDYSFQANFETAKKIASSIIEKVLLKKLGTCKLLNVNIPATAEVKGIKVCRQARGRWVEEFQEGTDPRGEKYYWLTGKFFNEDEGKDTDIYALENQFASVVPSGYDLTHHETIPTLQYLETNF